MRYLLALFLLPLMAQTPDYGRTAQAGALYDFTAAARTMPIKAGPAAATPSTCTASKELYVKTDVTAGQQLFLCNATGDGFVVVGDGAGGGSYTLPAASASSLGGIRIGPGLSIDGSGIVTAAGDGGSYTLPAASASSLGGIRIGPGLSIDGSGIVTAAGGGGGGTINSGAGKGIWFPWGVSSYSNAGVLVSGTGTRRGYRLPLIVPAQMEARAIHAYIFAASGTCGGTCGFQFAIYTHDMTSIVASTTVATSGGTPNINTTGAARFLFGAGSAVNSGVLTLAPGVYWIVPQSDSATLSLSTYGDTKSVTIANATTTTATTPAGTLVGYASVSDSLNTGSGATLAAVGNISGVTWTSSALAVWPILALVN